MKAVKITAANQGYLASRYGEDDDLDVFPVGYNLVTHFGDNGEYRYDGVIDDAELDRLFVRGQTLHNNFFEITNRQEDGNGSEKNATAVSNYYY